MKLTSKVAIVTGGSRGIGLATVKAFIEAGATVILTASSQANAEKAVASLKAEYPEATVGGISPNLADLAEVEKSFDEVVATYGKIDILVNNAGVSESTPLSKYTEELFDKVMDLNVKGVFNCTKAAVKHMEPQGSGVINSYLPDPNAPGAVKTGEVELVAGVVLKNTLKAAVLKDIAISAA